MSLKAFLKRLLMEYFVITTCVTAAIGVLGLSLDPTARIGYEGYFSPLLFGLVSIVPSVVTYSRKELTLRKTLVRKLFHFLILEATLIAFGHWVGVLEGLRDTISFAAAVFAIYLTVLLMGWLLDSREASQINQSLKEMQKRQ
jgi:hypothetical protein